MWIGMGLLAAYSLPLFAPPAGVLLPGAPANLLERLFPGVPAWWVGARLLAFFGGVALIALDLLRHEGGLIASGSGATAVEQRASAALLTPALLVAVLMLAAAFFATSFTRFMQIAYVPALAVPALILSLGGLRRAGGEPRSGDVAFVWIGVIAVVWLGLQAMQVFHSPLGARAVDTWIGWQHLEWAAQPETNLLTDGFLPGVTAIHLLTLGGGIFGVEGVPLRFEWVQVAQMFWLAASGVGVGYVTSIIAGRGAAVFAGAAFLFAPFSWMPPSTPAAYCVGPLFALGAIAPLVAFWRSGSAAAWAATAAGAGVASLHPWTLPTSVLVLAFAGWHAFRRHLPRRALAVGACVYIAALLPGLPRLLEMAGVSSWYGSGAWAWATLEASLLGQVSHIAAEMRNQVTAAGAFDIQLGSLLAPVAIPRQAIRLVGDTMFEPLTAMLAGLGVILCCREARRDARAVTLLALLATTIAPAFFMTTYDRPSLNRLAVLPVPIAILAGVGFAALRRRLVSPQHNFLATLVTAGAVIAGGTLLGSVINPRMLAGSWLSIAFEALGDTDQQGAVVLEPHSPQRTFTWLQARPIAANVPLSPVSVVAYEGPWTLDHIAPRVLFWSPGHEEYQAVGAQLCERWPAARVDVLFDDARLARVFALVALAGDWRASLPPQRLESLSCRQFVDERTQARDRARAAARRAILEAQLLSVRGDQVGAENALRQAAFAGVIDAELFLVLAQTLLANETAVRGEEAQLWAERACDLTGFRDPMALATLAAAYRVVGHDELAGETERTARQLARQKGGSVSRTEEPSPP